MKNTIEINKRKKSKVHIEMDMIAKRDGVVTRNSIVKEAQKKETALHENFKKRGLFDSKKAMKFAQLTYAGVLIRQYKVWVSIEDKEPLKIRAYPSLREDRNKPEGGYRPIINIMTDDDKRDKLLEDAKWELSNFQKKYSILSELAPVFEAISQVV